MIPIHTFLGIDLALEERSGKEKDDLPTLQGVADAAAASL